MITFTFLTPKNDKHVKTIINIPKRGWFRPRYVEIIEYTRKGVFVKNISMSKGQENVVINLRQQANLRIIVQYVFLFFNYNEVVHILVPDERPPIPPSNLNFTIMESYNDES